MDRALTWGMCIHGRTGSVFGEIRFHPIVDENGASMELEIEGDPQPGSEYGVVYSNQGKGITFTDGGGTLYSRLCPATGRAGRLRSGSVRFTGLKPAARRRFKLRPHGPGV